jgi:hypothetical protein
MAVVAVVALCSAPALAQPVFYDDFDGRALLPHWNQPPPSDWEYNVSNGMLNVTDLFYPSSPKSPTNYTFMGASFAPQTDLQLDFRMGWGEGVARFDLTLLAGAGIIATIGYCEILCTTDPGIFARHGASRVAIPAPPPGMYDFRITRAAGQFNFYFEGDLFASFQDIYGGPVNGLSFYFSSPYPGPSGPFHIDRVQVVPAPATVVAPVLTLAWACRRKRQTAP